MKLAARMVDEVARGCDSNVTFHAQASSTSLSAPSFRIAPATVHEISKASRQASSLKNKM